ncbi:hypothetical protein [Sediminimonas qiaohouensis]|uniref:hypothetical protein n=1 Tax=Sediminimonas qiaohouensis TaxID=552061 RepID=UPI00047BFAAA|nr:hypothetical protein [Sediminimonas qiaohouensis]
MGETQRVASRPRQGAIKRDIDIRGLLEWAFQRELVSLDFDELATVSGERPGIGTEYILMQRHNLGCAVDGGGSSEPHPDADVVASALAALPEARGGRRMALWIAALARSGRAPDWMPGAKPRCVPVEWSKNRHGWRAKSEPCGSVNVVSRGRLRTVEVRHCPVTYSPTAQQIASARRAYLQWWGALQELRVSFQMYGGLTSFRVTDGMPPRMPWKKSS